MLCSIKFIQNLQDMIMARTNAKKYLNVKYADRELAKRLGARWDPSVQRWYCPLGAPLAKIFKWRAETPQAAKPKGYTAHNENFELPLAG